MFSNIDHRELPRALQRLLAHRPSNPAATLPRGKQPTAAEIDAAMDGNICRCGTYARIRAAVADAARTLA